MQRIRAAPASTKPAPWRLLRALPDRAARRVSTSQNPFPITRRAFHCASSKLTSLPTASHPLGGESLTSPPRVSKDAGPPARPRRYGVLLSIAIFLSIGYAAGRTLSMFLVPPPLPESGSIADEAYLQPLEAEADRLPMVQELRAHPDEWEEFAPHKQSERSEPLSIGDPVLDASGKAQVQISGLIRSIWGSFGVGYYRVFWNAKENRTITIAHLGISLSGWPSVVHGGAIATLLQENAETLVQLGRDAAATPNKQSDQKQPPRIRSLQLKYKRPTHAQQFYIIRTQGDDGGQQHQRAVTTHIEDARTGLITAEAVGETLP